MNVSSIANNTTHCLKQRQKSAREKRAGCSLIRRFDYLSTLFLEGLAAAIAEQQTMLYVCVCDDCRAFEVS